MKYEPPRAGATSSVENVLQWFTHLITWNKIFQMPHREQAFGEGVGSAHGIDLLVCDGKTNSLE